MALRKLHPSYRRSIEASSARTLRLHVVPAQRPTHSLDTLHIDVPRSDWHPQQHRARQSLPASELCVDPSIRRAAKSWICADAASCSCHIPPGGTVRRHLRCRCPSLNNRMPRHFTISFYIFSAKARVLRVCQAAHSRRLR